MSWVPYTGKVSQFAFLADERCLGFPLITLELNRVRYSIVPYRYQVLSVILNSKYRILYVDLQLLGVLVYAKD